MYSYDRSKTAAKMDLHSEWRDIVDYNETKEHRDFQALLKKMVPYFKSVGYDLLIDDRRTFISKEHHGSDGWRIAGQLVIRDREENVTQTVDPDRVSMWVDEAIDTRGRAVLDSRGPQKGRNGDPLSTWVVDITAY